MGALIGAFGGWLLTVLTSQVALKIAKTASFAAVVAGLTLALITGIETAVAPLAVSLPDDARLFGAAILPTNLTTCISVVVIARIARWAYDWNVRFAKNLAQ